MPTSPFFVDPLGGQGAQIGQGLAGLGQVLGERREEKKTQADIAAAQAAFESGDPDKIAEVVIANPEIGRRIGAAVGFKNQATQDNMKESLRRIVSGENPEQVIQERIDLVNAQGGDASQSVAELERLRADPEAFMKQSEQALALLDPQGYTALRQSQGSLDKPTAQREFEHLTGGLSAADVEKAKRIKLGLDPRAVGSSAVTIAEEGKTGLVADSQAAIEGAKAGSKERAKLVEQGKLKPKVAAAIKRAEAKAIADIKSGTTKVANASALNVYEVAMEGLIDALGGAHTGPAIGLMPAITANQQIASGAVSAMAPVLKSIFRASGEGVFTDKDQQLLLDMVPTRTDLPEAITAKLANIDRIVRAKLGGLGEELEGAAVEDMMESESGLPEGVTESDIEATMQANNMTREEVLEAIK